MKSDKIIVLLAIIAIILSIIVFLDSYGKLTMAYEMCLNNGVVYI